MYLFHGLITYSNTVKDWPILRAIYVLFLPYLPNTHLTSTWPTFLLHPTTTPSISTQPTTMHPPNTIGNSTYPTTTTTQHTQQLHPHNTPNNYTHQTHTVTPPTKQLHPPNTHSNQLHPPNNSTHPTTPPTQQLYSTQLDDIQLLNRRLSFVLSLYFFLHLGWGGE